MSASRSLFTIHENHPAGMSKERLQRVVGPWVRRLVGRFACCPLGAQGIEAEIPQTRRRRGEELERKARFFAEQKMRQNSECFYRFYLRMKGVFFAHIVERIINYSLIIILRHCY
jgi:hypothetical protein